MFDKTEWSKKYHLKLKVNGYYKSRKFKDMKSKSDKKWRLKNHLKINKAESDRYNKMKSDPIWIESERERKRLYQREYHRTRGRELERNKKLLIISKYGGKCMCCGELTPEFLAVDHINGGGNKHRREMGIKGGRHFYDWLVKNNFPDGFQILCHNCNFAKDHYLKGCPHKDNIGGD